VLVGQVWMSEQLLGVAGHSQLRMDRGAEPFARQFGGEKADDHLGLAAVTQDLHVLSIGRPDRVHRSMREC
jgi:hypothetical protein